MILDLLNLLSVGGEQKLIEVSSEEIPSVSVETKPRFLIANRIFGIVLA